MSEVSETPTDLEAVQSALASLRCLSTFFNTRCSALETMAFPCLQSTIQQCLQVSRGTVLTSIFQKVFESAPVPQVLLALYPCYENMSINDIDGVAGIEEDVEGGPTSLVVQVCSICNFYKNIEPMCVLLNMNFMSFLVLQFCHLLTVCTSRAQLCHEVIEGHVQEILGAIVKYMQITELEVGVL